MSNLGSFITGAVEGLANEEEQQRKRRQATPPAPLATPTTDPNGVTFSFAKQVNARDVEPPSLSVSGAGGVSDAVGGE